MTCPHSLYQVLLYADHEYYRCLKCEYPWWPKAQSKIKEGALVEQRIERGMMRRKLGASPARIRGNIAELSWRVLGSYWYDMSPAFNWVFPMDTSGFA